MTLCHELAYSVRVVGNMTTCKEMIIHDVPGDGDCFYTCVSRLRLNNVFGTPPHGEKPQLHIRKQIAKIVEEETRFMESHKDTYVGLCNVFKNSLDMMKTLTQTRTSSESTSGSSNANDLTKDYAKEDDAFRKYRKKGEEMRKRLTQKYEHVRKHDDELLGYIEFKIRKQIIPATEYVDGSVIAFVKEYLLSKFRVLLIVGSLPLRPVQYASREEVDSKILQTCARNIDQNNGLADHVCVLCSKDEHFNYVRFVLDDGTSTYSVPCDVLQRFINVLLEK